MVRIFAVKGGWLWDGYLGCDEMNQLDDLHPLCTRLLPRGWRGMLMQQRNTPKAKQLKADIAWRG